MKEIIVNVDSNNNKTIILLEEGVVLEKYNENAINNRLEGNIYLGKVQNVLKGMQAAFVDIGEEKNTFIHLKDILAKIDEKQEDINQVIQKQDIKNLIKPGDNLIVQIKRDGTNKKGARVSTHLNLPGRYCVLMPNTPFITVSQKIEDKKEKARLIKIVQEALPDNCGAIIRTSSIGKQEEEIQKDVHLLYLLWEEIEQKAKQQQKAPVLLNKSYGMIEKILLDLVDQNIDKITVNNKQEYQAIIKIVKQMNEPIKVELREENLLEWHEIKKQIEKLEHRKIWLKCGGFITIDKTEALTAIDVNSGKYTGNQDLEHTVFEVNKEASVEIAKQLRLRDIGGIIIIDYIDMQQEENKEKIIQILKENLKKDRSKTQIVGFSKLNLLEMTRKHMCSQEE